MFINAGVGIWNDVKTDDTKDSMLETITRSQNKDLVKAETYKPTACI
jgi:hypothetical protein